MLSGSVGAETLHVMVGVIQNERGEVLVSQRQAGKRYAGFWEFPGGKLEPGETPADALARELKEELGLRVEAAHPLMCFQDPFAEIPIVLDVWCVTAYSGGMFTEGVARNLEADGSEEAGRPGCPSVGREGQPLLWADYPQLVKLKFPPANLRILKRLGLPCCYAITPPALGEPGLTLTERLALLQGYVEKYSQTQLEANQFQSRMNLAPKPILQLRAHGMSQSEYEALLAAFLANGDEGGADCSGAHGVQVIGNRYDWCVQPAQVLVWLKVLQHGLHIPQSRLMALADALLNPAEAGAVLTAFRCAIAAHPWPVGASCHDRQALKAAEQLGFDYAIVSQIRATPSHPGVAGIGWGGLRELIRNSQIPVYALGGLTVADLPEAFATGAIGVAGIRAFVGEETPVL